MLLSDKLLVTVYILLAELTICEFGLCVLGLGHHLMMSPGTHYACGPAEVLRASQGDHLPIVIPHTKCKNSSLKAGIYVQLLTQKVPSRWLLSGKMIKGVRTARWIKSCWS